MAKLFFCISTLFGGLGVTFGAFGAHYLKRTLSTEMLTVFETGVRYQMYHAFALFIAAWGVSQLSHPFFTYAGYAFTVGTLLFSGSLYILTNYSTRFLGLLTPIGGLILIVGWLFLFLGFLKGEV